MHFKVYRNGEHLCNVELHKSGAEWEAIENRQIIKGDILESIPDGVKLEVLENNPIGYQRAAFRTKTL